MRNRIITISLLVGVVVVLGFRMTPDNQENEEIFTIYLVRHAEKDLNSSNPSDPPLTPCGEERSEMISQFLSHIELDAIYSTEYSRTKSTAQPTADIKSMSIESYDPRALSEFASTLIQNKEDALVVGHSNTTAVLAGLLVGEELGAFDESIYNRIYQVVIHKESGRLHVFHTAFSCE
ncbi:MAG: histidine phosphatase family protein [Flavobacteriales bacterium]|nr:histidine phosphatase family protein [Flavobacteriales bacterium]